MNNDQPREAITAFDRIRAGNREEADWLSALAWLKVDPDTARLKLEAIASENSGSIYRDEAKDVLEKLEG
jgi:hypothetical protein